MTMHLDEWLAVAKERNASDLYIKAYSPPILRIYGQFHALTDQPLTPRETETIAMGMMDNDHLEHFKVDRQVNLAYWKPELGRFRVNIYQQRGTTACVMRQVKSVIPSFEALRLPLFLKEVALERRGLVLITGATGMGKSTTLAAMVDHRNHSRPGHIVTLEDPIEYLYEDDLSLISQRELGMDVGSWTDGLKDALRQAPDVIVIGELRDEETVSSALHFAETGHLVLATLHSNNVTQALERIVSFFPSNHQNQAYLEISLNLRVVVSQVLLPRNSTAPGGVSCDGMLLACEVLVNTPYVRDLIRNGQLPSIQGALKKGSFDGMRTFDQSIYQLYAQGLISRNEVVAAAQSPSEMKLRIEGLLGKDD
ncbi:MAG: PilT/PilU family type 4a pilus ATPase [Coprothermobacterota bacterium]|nr:PilT/PilU family type 4a pilus ATPase [Coprothermobacterota bacterium]